MAGSSIWVNRTILAALLALGSADWALLSLVVAPAVFTNRADSTVAPIAQQSPATTGLPSATAGSHQPVAAADPRASLTPPAVVKACAGASLNAAPAAAAPPEAPTSTPSVRPQPDADSVCVPFATASAMLEQQARRALLGAARRLKSEPGARVLLVGHSDPRGPEELNIRLSRKRAEVAAAYLTNMGVAPSRIDIEAAGASRLLDSSGTHQAHARNRRVEVVWR